MWIPCHGREFWITRVDHFSSNFVLCVGPVSFIPTPNEGDKMEFVAKKNVPRCLNAQFCGFFFLSFETRVFWPWSNRTNISISLQSLQIQCDKPIYGRDKTKQVLTEEKLQWEKNHDKPHFYSHNKHTQPHTCNNKKMWKTINLIFFDYGIHLLHIRNK